MKLLIDCHAHFYPDYSAENFFLSAYKNLNQIDAEATYAVVLLASEKALPRSEFIVRLKAERSDVAVESFPKFDVVSLKEKKLLIFHGCQIVSSEGLEALCLFYDYKVRRTLELSDLVADIQKSDGIAVVPWSLGKWWGTRGEALSRALEKNSGKDLFLGDVCQRPQTFGTLEVLAKTHKLLGVLGGSDPLPMVGDEKRVASLVTAVKIEGEIDGSLESRVREELCCASKLSVVGHKDSLLKMLGRWVQFYFEKRKRASQG